MKNRLLNYILVVLAFFLFSSPAVFSIVPVKHVKEIHFLLSIDILAVGEFGMENLGQFSAEIPSGKKGLLGKAIELKGKGSSETIGLELKVLAKPKGEFRIRLDIQSSVSPLDPKDEKKISRREELDILEYSSHLMEIYRSRITGKKVILSIMAQKKNVDSFKVSHPSGLTPKVRFQLNIYRISRGNDILLEKNSLSTLLHQPASYYLYLYAGGKKDKRGNLSKEELDIKMTPLEISDDRISLEVNIEGFILKSNRETIPVQVKKVKNVANAESLFITVASEEEGKGEKTREGYKFEIIPVF